MSNNVVLDFVEQFFPEHLYFWKNLEYSKGLKLARNNLTSEECEELVLFPAKDSRLNFTFDLMKRNINDVQFILENSEAAYDVLLWKEISNFCPKFSYTNKYDFIFENPELYKKDLRICKTIGGCFKKLKGIIPNRYFETQYEGKEFFGEFSVKLDTVHFESRFEKVNFSHQEVYLIPYFIEYRNRHLIEWIYQEKAYLLGIKQLGIKETCNEVNKIALESKVNAENLITNRIRKLLHDKGYFEGIIVEWNQDYENRQIAVTYDRNCLGTKTKITKNIRAYKLEEDIKKMEIEL